MFPHSEMCKMSIRDFEQRVDGSDLSVPSYQRQYVWGKHQQKKFLHTISRGGPISGLQLNYIEEKERFEIMDGQNRIVTIVRFMDGQIPFEADDGNKIWFSEMTDRCQRKFKNKTISYVKTDNWSRNHCESHFRNIQEGIKLSEGEKIHSTSNNPLTTMVKEIYHTFDEEVVSHTEEGSMEVPKKNFISSPLNAKGMAIRPDRYKHYEMIGCLLHMVRMNKKVFPVRPAKTAYDELIWMEEEANEKLKKDLGNFDDDAE